MLLLVRLSPWQNDQLSPRAISVSPIISFTISVAILYFARELLIPLAFALLFAFLLSPIVKRLELWRVPRVAASLTVFIVAFGIIAGAGWAVTDQLVQIVAGLPRYTNNISRKVQMLKGGSGSLDMLIGSVEQIGREANVASPAPATPLRPGHPGAEERPVPVQIVESRNIFQSLRDLLSGLLGPLGTAGITIVFTLFMLIDRDDLRNRLLRLMGQGKMHTTTKAMDDAAQRVSRYVLLQFAVNACFGLVVGLGLYLLGVPSAFLWGSLAVLLRFLPYLGPVIAGSLPLILTIATTDGWRTPFFVFLLFLITELITGNLIEPLLYGVNTGLSTVAILVSAVFWTVLWGPTSLILSTPLTVCLSVLGRHIPQLEFLNILLGDEPVLPPDAILYQRLLAFDHRDAFTLMETFLKDGPVIKVYDNIVIPALAMLEQDRHSGRLEAKREDFILQSIKELVTEFGELEDPSVTKGGCREETHLLHRFPRRGG